MSEMHCVDQTQAPASQVSVVVFWGVTTHNIHKYSNTCNILSHTQNPLAQIPT